MHRTSPRALRTRRRTSPPPRSSTILTALPYLLAITLTVLCVLCFIPVARAESPESYGHVIGIDLGTTYSSVGIIKNGTVEIIPNSQGHRTTPSWVSFSPNSNERLIGDSAKHAFHENPSNTVFDVKRLVGRQFNDPDVQRDIRFLPYNVTERDGKPVIQVMHANEQKLFTPEEISAMVLGKMKETAEAYLGDKVTHAVITVPAYFNDAQRQATKDAGRIAGLTVLRIIHEPTAAAIAYGLDKRGGETNVLVYDLGGGTFDVSVLSIDDGVFEVLSTAGDTHLGGSDFDNRLTAHLQNLYLRATGTDLSSSPSPRVQGKFKRAAELAKRTLSSQPSVLVEINDLPLDVGGVGELSEIVTRATFEELNADLFSETLNVVARTLKDAGLGKGNIDEIVLVGGSTRIPKVREMLKAYFDGKELHTKINPDEAVAHGAAIQAGILSGEEMMGDILVMEITPLSFGIETTGGVMNVMVPRNSIIPTLKKQLFSTAQDNQSKVLIKVFEGERSLTKDNNQLGEFELSGIPPAPRGVPQIEVTFAIDADGILQVSAIDKATGESRSVTITNEHARLTEKEMDRMLLEAEEFAAADEAQRLKIEALGSLKNYVWDLRSELSEDDVSGQRITARDKQILLDTLTDASTWADGARYDTTREEVESRIGAIRAIAQPIISALHQGQGGGDGAVKEWTGDHHVEL